MQLPAPQLRSSILQSQFCCSISFVSHMGIESARMWHNSIILWFGSSLVMRYDFNLTGPFSLKIEHKNEMLPSSINPEIVNRRFEEKEGVKSGNHAFSQLQIRLGTMEHTNSECCRNM
ncbi:hypothetical protein BLOT_002664 [Blomia tropicalis]|nr:hypothetical protein BLOT_002664 [Blomia tropicalis]